MSHDVYITSAVRTPIGGFRGNLAEVSAVALGALAARAAISRAGGGTVDEVLFGNVLSAGNGQNVARQVALAADLDPAVGATTINKVCGSGMKSVMLADQAIRCGDATRILAGGTENMSQAPYLLSRAREGYRLGHGELIDSLIRDGLWDCINDAHMGNHADATARELGLTREALDDFAVRSYERALAAQAAGDLAREIVPVSAKQGRSTVEVSADEEPLRFNPEKLRGLRPAFDPDGTTTAGNASSINDGAAALVIASAATAGSQPLARIVAATSFARRPERFTLAPVDAIQMLLRRTGWQTADVDLYEINEAFSTVTLACMQALDLPADTVNIYGGAVALGHPIGCSGARILVTLVNAMQARNARRGIAAICIGGGEAVAVALERP